MQIDDTRSASALTQGPMVGSACPHRRCSVQLRRPQPDPRDLWPYAVAPERHPIDVTAACAVRQEEGTMSGNKNRHQGAQGGRSTRVALGPSFIEDVALTPSELARARATDISVVALRQS